MRGHSKLLDMMPLVSMSDEELRERLNDNEKEAIMYAFGIGVKQSLREDYARRCGVSSVTVYNRIRSGIKNLRKMAEEGMAK